MFTDNTHKTALASGGGNRYPPLIWTYPSMTITMYRYAVTLTLALFLGTATFADAQEKTRTAAEIQAEIDKLQIELQKAKKAEPVRIPLFDAPRDRIAPAPPTDEHVLQALERINPSSAGTDRNVKAIIKGLITDYVAPPRMIPMVGMAQPHHLHWKCTVYFDEVLQNGNRIHKKDAAEVLYIDRDYLYRSGEEAANHLAGTPVNPKDIRPESEHRILQQLEMPVVLGSHSSLPLEEALTLFCDQVKIPMFLDKSALHEAGISTNTEVAVPRGNGIKIKMKTVLDAVLEQHGLTYVVKNEMLTITSQRRAKGALLTRFYYVGDMKCETETVAVGSRVFSQDESIGPPFDSISKVIQGVVEPESWIYVGLGGEGTISVHPTTESLAVRQTEEVHAQIEDLLTQIRGLNTPLAAAAPEPPVVR